MIPENTEEDSSEVENGCYKVEYIIKEKMSPLGHTGLRYLVKWEGYPVS